VVAQGREGLGDDNAEQGDGGAGQDGDATEQLCSILRWGGLVTYSNPSGHGQPAHLPLFGSPANRSCRPLLLIARLIMIRGRLSERSDD
jgi:hypothetical protein